MERRARENVTFAGRIDDASLRDVLAAARGLIFPAEDDFGIVCVEALASGAAVVALASGGAPDIVRDGVDGVLVEEQTVEAFEAAVLRVERKPPDRAELVRRAAQFDRAAFTSAVARIVDDAYSAGRSGTRASA